MKDEIIDIFDDNYKHVGTCSKKQAHEKGFEQVKKYSWQKMAEETVGLYKELMS